MPGGRARGANAALMRGCARVCRGGCDPALGALCGWGGREGLRARRIDGSFALLWVWQHWPEQTPREPRLGRPGGYALSHRWRGARLVMRRAWPGRARMRPREPRPGLPTGIVHFCFSDLAPLTTCASMRSCTPFASSAPTASAGRNPRRARKAAMSCYCIDFAGPLQLAVSCSAPVAPEASRRPVAQRAARATRCARGPYTKKLMVTEEGPLIKGAQSGAARGTCAAAQQRLRWTGRGGAAGRTFEGSPGACMPCSPWLCGRLALGPDRGQRAMCCIVQGEPLFCAVRVVVLGAGATCRHTRARGPHWRPVMERTGGGAPGPSRARGAPRPGKKRRPTGAPAWAR